MAAQPSVVHQDLAPRLTPFEAAFVRTVLEHRGLFPSPASATSAGLWMCSTATTHSAWLIRAMTMSGHRALDADDMAALRAKAYMMFGVIRPTAAQWQKAHGALFGPMLCETCG